MNPQSLFCVSLFLGVFAAMAFMNLVEDHWRLTGGFVALMNVGMVAGLVVSW